MSSPFFESESTYKLPSDRTQMCTTGSYFTVIDDLLNTSLAYNYKHQAVKTCMMANAIFTDNIDMMNQLAKRGAKIDPGFAIQTAIKHHNRDALAWLCEKGIDVNLDKGIALRTALDNDNYQAIRYLVFRGANTNLVINHPRYEKMKSGLGG